MKKHLGINHKEVVKYLFPININFIEKLGKPEKYKKKKKNNP